MAFLRYKASWRGRAMREPARSIFLKLEVKLAHKVDAFRRGVDAFRRGEGCPTQATEAVGWTDARDGRAHLLLATLHDDPGAARALGAAVDTGIPAWIS